MAAIEQQLELRFRIFDGTDIGQGHYPLSTNIDTIKKRLLSEWPQGCASSLNLDINYCDKKQSQYTCHSV